MKKPYLMLFFVFLLTNNLFPQQTNLRIDSLQAVLKKAEAHEKVDVLNKLATEYNAIAPDKALEYALEAQQLAQEEGYKEGGALAAKNIGNSYLHLGSFDTAINAYNISFEKYTAIGDIEGMASSIANIGSIHSINREYTLALKNYTKALRFFETLKNWQKVATTTRLIGIVYGNLYDYPKALTYFRRSVEIARKIGDDNILAYSYNNIAIIYGNIHDHKNARLYYLKAIKAFKKTSNMRGANFAKANLATVYANMEDYDNAIGLLHDCINFTQKTNDQSNYAMYLSNIGMMYSKKGDFDNAQQYIQKAVQLHRKLKLKAELSRDLLNLGVIYREHHEPNKALEHLQEALPIAMEISDYWVINACYENLSEINASNGNLSKALENYKLYKAYNDSTLTEENQDKLAEMEVKFQTEQKEKENQLLQQDVRIKEMTIKQKNALIIIFIIVILVVVILMFIIYKFYKQKSKAYDILVRENLKLLHVENKLDQCIVDTPQIISKNVSEAYDQYSLLQRRFERFLVEEKPYLWVDVNVDEFCRKLNTNRSYLSRLINNRYNKSFSDLLSEYRIRTARNLLSDPSKKHLSIEGIGEMSGFKTNSTFHKKFKSLLHITPQQFRERALKERESVIGES